MYVFLSLPNIRCTTLSEVSLGISLLMFKFLGCTFGSTISHRQYRPRSHCTCSGTNIYGGGPEYWTISRAGLVFVAWIAILGIIYFFPLEIVECQFLPGRNTFLTISRLALSIATCANGATNFSLAKQF